MKIVWEKLTNGCESQISYAVRAKGREWVSGCSNKYKKRIHCHHSLPTHILYFMLILL